MYKRYGGLEPETVVFQAINNPLNLLSFIYARIYFPTYSNGLKDIAKYLGFRWTESNPAGIQTIIWRTDWEQSGDVQLKERTINYNAEDCEALNHVTEFIRKISISKSESINTQISDVIDIDSISNQYNTFHDNQFCLPALEEINKAAYWDYQHEKIIIRTSKRSKRIAKSTKKRLEVKIKVNNTIHWPPPQKCPRCGQTKIYPQNKCAKTLFDVRFGKSGIKRWVTKYIFSRYRCPKCGPPVFCNVDRTWSGYKFGPNLIMLSIYLNIDLRLTEAKVAEFINQFFGYKISGYVINRFKKKIAASYKSTFDNILQKIITGNLIHADETQLKVIGKVGYVWAFTNLENVVYMYAPSREGDLVHNLLKDFKGVLITDFYTAYDSLHCPQQKCLIHLIRDLNSELMKEPFNEEFKTFIVEFANLLRAIITTIDRFGLKTRFLRKHKIDVKRFNKNFAKQKYETEAMIKWRKRFEKNRNKLFTFLDYDNVPWNNNNAEHAIKTIAVLRKDLGGTSTERGITDYLILLSVRETCRFYGISFLDFLRSGEKDVDVFVNNKVGRSRRTTYCSLQIPQISEREENIILNEKTLLGK